MNRQLFSIFAGTALFTSGTVLSEVAREPVLDLDLTGGRCVANLRVDSKNLEFVREQPDAGAKFNGRDSFVIVFPHEKLNNLSSFTAELWFKWLGRPPEGVNFTTLLSKNLTGDGRRDTFNFGIWCADPDGKRTLWARFGDGNSAIEIRAREKEISDEKFHHAALVYDGDSAYIYLDGLLVASHEFLPGWQPYGKTPPDPIIVGVWTGYRNYFNGIISSVKIYDTVLSPEEISDKFKSGKQ